MTIKIGNYNELNEEIKHLIDIIAKAYTQTYGIEKWNSLTAKEQHDVVMILVKDFNNSL